MKKIFSDVIFDYLSIESGADIDDFSTTKIGDIKLDCYKITTDKQVKYYKKPIGTYNLLTIPNVLAINNNTIQKIAKITTELIINYWGKLSVNDKLLVIGLGNRHISSDSLGAKVVGKLDIVYNSKTLPKVMAFCPSVMGLTGMESATIVEGIVDKVRPTHLILVDSLCASNIDRLGKSIQVSNTGICPGSGIGNKRKCIGGNLAKNIMTIGIPLLIYSHTIIDNCFEKNLITQNSINGIMHDIKKLPNNAENIKILTSLKKMINSNDFGEIMSIKDIDECTDILSKIISMAINNYVLK